jgi:hypothetical protein
VVPPYPALIAATPTAGVPGVLTFYRLHGTEGHGATHAVRASPRLGLVAEFTPFGIEPARWPHPRQRADDGPQTCQRQRWLDRRDWSGPTTDVAL